MNINVIGGADYGVPFHEFGEVRYTKYADIITRGGISYPPYHNDNLLVFTGGADVSPHLYGERPHPRTSSNNDRDIKEIAAYRKALCLGMPMVGICRGSQFLNVMNGGKIYQHQMEHAGPNHTILTSDGDAIEVTSTHHQISIPTPQARILAVANELPHPELEEVEVFYYPLTKCLCVQYHPEYMPKDSEGYLYFTNLVTLLLEGKLDGIQ